MTYRELYGKLNRILPNCSFGDDNDGQLIIYTGVKANISVEDDDTEVIPMEDEEDDPILDTVFAQKVRNAVQQLKDEGLIT